MIRRPWILLLATSLAWTACADSAGEGPPDPEISSPPSPAASSPATAGPSTSGTPSAAPTTAAVPTTATTPTITTAAPTTEGDAGSGEGATGHGVLAVGERTFDMIPVACGWLAAGVDSRSVPLLPEPSSRNAFRLVAVGPVGDGLIALELDLDRAVGAIFGTVLRFVPSDPEEDFMLVAEGLVLDLVSLEGGAVRSNRALPMRRGTERDSAEDVTFDITCDTFGGVLDEIDRLAAEALGLPFEEPVFDGVGTVVLDGEAYTVATTSCVVRGPGDVELLAEGDDGALSLSVIVSPVQDVVFVEWQGERYVRDRDFTVVVEGDLLGSAGAVTMVELVTREPGPTIAFEVPCS